MATPQKKASIAAGALPAVPAVPSFSILSKQKILIEEMLSSPRDLFSGSSSSYDSSYLYYSSSGGPGAGALSQQVVWKVLIYDSAGRDILGPLIHVSDLRNHGVTLHMMITSSNRQPIPEVPAVYFLAPTKENIERIVKDCQRAMYDSYWVYWTYTISRENLELFAEKIALLSSGNGMTKGLNGASTPSKINIGSVYDLYADFLSLEHDLFSLALKNTYTFLNHPKLTDTLIENTVQNIVESLFSVIVTLNVLPIIRAQRNGPAEMIAQKLDAMIREQLLIPNNVFVGRAKPLAGSSGIMSGAGAAVVAGSGTGGMGMSTGDTTSTTTDGGSMDRPVLILIDRNIDLPVMLHHSWTYQALAHDLLDLSLNRVKVPENDPKETAAATTPSSASTDSAIPTPPIKTKTYDLDHSDSFWTENARNPFPKVAENVESVLAQYRKDVDKINAEAGKVGQFDAILQGDQNSAGQLYHDLQLQQAKMEANGATQANSAEKLAKAISAIPELTRRKQKIDLHTNIATAMLDQIKDRGLDSFFQAEEGLLSNSGTVDLNAVLQLLRDIRGTPNDKLRLALIYYLVAPKEQITPTTITTLTETLAKAGANVNAFEYVKSVRSFTTSMQTAPLVAAGGRKSSSQELGGFMSSVVEHGVKGLTQVANNFNRMMVQAERPGKVAEIVASIIDMKTGSDAFEAHTYLDPKADKNSRNVYQKKPFNKALVFIVGGGNYIEYQNVKEHCQKSGKQVIYGATDLVTASDFLTEMANMKNDLPENASIGIVLR